MAQSNQYYIHFLCCLSTFNVSMLINFKRLTYSPSRWRISYYKRAYKINLAPITNANSAKTAMENASQVVANYIKNLPKYNNNITAELLQQIYHELRPLNKISLQQTKASINDVCFCELFLEDEVLDVLQEMDRRSFLMRDIEWEFTMLAGANSHLVSLDEAELLFRCYCGEEAPEKWDSFITSRVLKDTRISLAEIEVILCSKRDENNSIFFQDETKHELVEKDTSELDSNE